MNLSFYTLSLINDFVIASALDDYYQSLRTRNKQFLIEKNKDKKVDTLYNRYEQITETWNVRNGVKLMRDLDDLNYIFN